MARSKSGAGGGARRGSLAKKLIVAALLAGVGVFAVQGGEYGTMDLYRQRGRRVALEAGLDTLRRQVDSLTRLKKALQTDPALQERVAREEFGMVRGDREMLYRLVEPRGVDSASRDGSPE